MDLLTISRKIWRHRIVTLPVIVLTLLGALYVVAIKDSEYWASSSYVLINPPAPPTAEEIAADPSLGRINSDNPFTRFTDQAVVVDLLSSTLSNDAARRALTRAGADDRYTVAPSSEFGFSSQLVEITGVGSTPGQAVGTAELVGAALTRELDRLQASRGVDTDYRIEPQRVVAPDHAEERVSGKLRTLVGVFAMGAILLFVVISVAEGLSTLRAERSKLGVPKDKRRLLEGAATNISRAREWLRGLRGVGATKEVTRENNNQGSFEDAGTNNSPSHQRQRRPRRARSKEAVATQKDEEESIEEKDKQGSFEDAGTNNSPSHQRQRRPRRAGSKA